MMIVMRVIFLLVIAFTATACLPFGKGCGYSAYYVEHKDGSEIQIQLRIVEAETVGGHTDCGYKHVPTKVASATLRGVEMREIKVADNAYLYAAPPDFDPTKDVIAVKTMTGSHYTSEPDSVTRNGDSVYFNLH